MLLARHLADEAELTVIGRAGLDFSDSHAVRETVRASRPEFVLNAAAYTAVDRAEQEPELARQVNAVAPGVIAEEVAKTNGWLIHYSTDYVFDGSGDQPRLETDPTGPLGVYGQTKLEGELAIAATGCKHVILRTSWVYAVEGKNFLHTMLRLGRERERLSIVDDQIGAPTSAEAITEASRAVLRKLSQSSSVGAEKLGLHTSGVFHLTCGGATSWCGFAKEIFRLFAAQQKPPELVPIPTEAYPTPARRPKNSRLCCDKFVGRFGYEMPQWEAALDNVASAVMAKRAVTISQ